METMLHEVIMKNSIKIIILSLAAVSLSVFAAGAGIAQEPQQAETQPGPVQDPIRQLNLSPEQREKIRAIVEEKRQERIGINQQLRLASRGLQEALDSENPDEALVEQRLRDVAAAQAAQMRMRVLTEVRIRRVLSAEQQSLLRVLRQQARRERQLEKANAGQGNGTYKSRRFPNQHNGFGPLLSRPAGSQPKERP
jgi:Spy/CpxP family protein refolding chaperone